MTDMSRVQPTGVPGLDAVLTGGLVPGSLVFIVAPPGAGKTVLASQILFLAARQGVPTLLYSTYSENQTKLLQHLQSFTFFDGTLIGNAVQLFALPDITALTPTEAVSLITAQIRQADARLVLIDGLQSVDPLLANPAHLHQFLAGLSTRLAYLHTTLLVTITGEARDPQTSGWLTSTDTLIGLTYTVDSRRTVRLLDVVKQRGRAQLPGHHAYAIGADGMTVWPRLESYARPTTLPTRMGRAAFGLAELDELLHGGLTEGTITLLAGAPGTGKTTLALHWALHTATPEQPTIFMTFREYESQLVRKAMAFGLDLAAAQARGAVHVVRIDSVELQVDLVAQQVLALLAQHPSRLIIDDVAPLLLALDDRASMYLAALAAQLHKVGVTSLFLYEIAAFVGLRLDLSTSPLGMLGENLILLQQQEMAGILHRVLAVVRMRFSDYDPTVRELVLAAQGIRVLRPEHTGRGVLDTAAGQQGGATHARPNESEAPGST